MEEIESALGSVVGQLSDQNYAHSAAFYRLWFDIGQTYPEISSDHISEAIWNNRGTGSMNTHYGKFIHSTAPLIARLASDVASDNLLATGLQSRLSTRSLHEFFRNNLNLADGHTGIVSFYTDANFIAHWANLGYVEEAAIHNHILQSLIFHPTLYDHQADALIILFKLAGATFEAYADSLVIDRCFELLKRHSYSSPYPSYDRRYKDYVQPRTELVQVSASRTTRCDYRVEEGFQEVVGLRERGWEGLPPPPASTSGRANPAGANQRDPAATPVATSLGLPNRDLEPQPPPSEPVTASETGGIPESPVTPVAPSPSITIATLSDFTVADVSDDENTSDGEPPIDPTTVVPHETFYLEDGNAEVLCGNTLFRVHTTILFFHSPALRRMFAQTNLATAESPNGCPRILSTDTARDFATLLKTIYLPGFVALPACRSVVQLTDCPSADSLNGTQYQISLHFLPSSASRGSTRCPPSDPSYSRLSATLTLRPSRDSGLPSRLERASSPDGLLTRTRSSTSSSSRGSRRHCPWHTTWRPNGV